MIQSIVRARRHGPRALTFLIAVAIVSILVGCSVASPFASASPIPGQTSTAAAKRNLVTILLLGIDQRPDEAARHIPSRTDTMILVVVDPTSKRAALVSIPRDLIVAIPGHGNQKINTAHFWGESDEIGSGPDLAARTVENNFGVHVDYYARVDFSAFERGIDALGGIVVDVQRPILDDEYPTENYGVKRVFIPGGPQWMDGARALEFVRSRHSGNDFGRQARQRQVILAAESKLLRPEMALKVPEFVSVVRQSLATNIPPTKLPWLLYLAASIGPSNVVDAGITYDMLVDVNKDGSEFLPDRVKIQHLLDTVLDNPPSSSASNPTATPNPVAVQDPVRVEILNGTTRDGLAATLADALKTKGFSIARVAQADTSDQVHTLVTDRSGARHAGPTVAKAVGVPSATVVLAPAQTGLPDVTVVLGYDVPDPRQS